MEKLKVGDVVYSSRYTPFYFGKIFDVSIVTRLTNKLAVLDNGIKVYNTPVTKIESDMAFEIYGDRWNYYEKINESAKNQIKEKYNSINEHIKKYL